MTTTAEDLRAEAATHRQHLGQTVDAIEDRVSPGRIIERRTNRMRDSLQHLRDSVMGSADHASHRIGEGPDRMKEGVSSLTDSAMSTTAGSPLAAGAVAFGLGFLAAVAFPGTKVEHRAATRLQEAAEPLVDEAKEISRDAAAALREPAQDAARHVREAAQEQAAEVQQTAKDQTSQATSAARHAAGDLEGEARATVADVRDQAAS